MKQTTYDKENLFFSVYAKKSIDTKGRMKEEEPCSMRTDFQRDRDRIIYSKAFRRLKNKTQVFISPEGDHYITRLTHTLNVAQIGRSIARELNLNEDLTEAIALGHDLGHTPFGHAGERCLNKLTPNGFKHNEQSLRVVDKIEKLNLTYEVRDGILNHKTSCMPQTLEGQVVRIADKIAYLNHDIDDAIRAGILSENDLPQEITTVLGDTLSHRIDNMISSIVRNSFNKPQVAMEDEFWKQTLNLKAFMNEKVYRNEHENEQEGRAFLLIEALYNYYKNHIDKLPDVYKNLLEEDGIDRVVCDYISSMTDRYCTYVFEDIFIPKNFMLR